MGMGHFSCILINCAKVKQKATGKSHFPSSFFCGLKFFHAPARTSFPQPSKIAKIACKLLKISVVTGKKAGFGRRNTLAPTSVH